MSIKEQLIDVFWYSSKECKIRQRSKKIKQSRNRTRERRQNLIPLAVETKIQMKSKYKRELDEIRLQAKWFYNFAVAKYKEFINEETKDYDGWEKYKTNILLKSKQLQVIPVKYWDEFIDQPIDKLQATVKRWLIDQLERWIKSWIANLKTKNIFHFNMKFKREISTLTLKQEWVSYFVEWNRIRIPFLHRKRWFKLFWTKQFNCAQDIAKEAKLIHKWWNYYVVFTTYIQPRPIETQLEAIIWIDIGLKDQLTINFGWNDVIKLQFDSLQKAEDEVKHYQRMLSFKRNRIKRARKRLGEDNNRKAIRSKNYYKQQLKLRKAYIRLDNLKKEREQKIRHILKAYHICIEDINLQVWQKLWWRKSQSIRLWKIMWTANSAQISQTKVWRFYASTKTCSNCWYKKKKMWLDERVYCCENCCISMDRDWNAAKNILFEWTKNLSEEVLSKIKTSSDRGKGSMEVGTSAFVWALENACIWHLVHSVSSSVEVENSNCSRLEAPSL